MAEDDKSRRGTGAVKYIAAGAVAALTLGLAAFAIQKNTGPIKIDMGQNGIGIQIERSDDFATILVKAIHSDDGLARRTARSILRGEGFVEVSQIDASAQSKSLLADAGYFHFRDRDLAQKIRNTRFDDAEDLRRDYHDILWNKDGPFTEGTLTGAPPRFLDHFQELHAKLSSDGEVAPLLKEMWLRGIDWKPPFNQMKFTANVEIRPEADDGNLYVCLGAEHIAGKYVQLSIARDDDPSRRAEGTGSIERKATIDEDVLACDNGRSIGDMLGGVPVRFGISPSTAGDILLPGEKSGPLPPQFEAQFLVRPRYLVSETEVISQ